MEGGEQEPDSSAETFGLPDPSSKEFEPELGQAVFSNSPWAELRAESHVIAGIDLLDELVAELGEDGSDGSGGGDEEFENGTFELRPYCWCGGEREGHEEGCPPNFRFGDFEVRWYKHSHRGASQSRRMPKDEWRTAVLTCLASLDPSK